MVASYLGIRTLQGENVEGDELFSRRVAMADTGTAFNLIKEDLVHPPLYYFALKAVLPLTGTSATGIRVLSLVSGIASIAVVLLWGVAVPYLRRPALLAAALLALNPTHVFYSQQARSYALYGLLVCLLILWALLLDKFWTRHSFWLIGTVLMIALFYTHYVGALFGGVLAVLTLIRSAPRIAKIRMAMMVGIAVLAFTPWLFLEFAVFQSKHGLAANLSWQGLPTWYDLRAIWASFLGVPRFRGGTLVPLSVAVLLAGFAFRRSSKTGDKTITNNVNLLLGASILPPLLLFATRFKPLALTVFDQRHLLPAIFPCVMLVALGLIEASDLFPRPKASFAIGAIGLCCLQISELSLTQSKRQPYSAIAAALGNRIDKAQAVYTTFPYGIGEPVNFYLKSNVVRPLFASSGTKANIPENFFLLYRPAVQKEQADVTALLRQLPAVREQCDYYSSPAEMNFGTQLCFVSWSPTGNSPASGNMGGSF